MNYTVDYLPDKKIVSIKMKGRLNFQIAETYSRDAVKLARQNYCSKFLMDHTETSIKGGIYKLHAAGAELQQFGFLNSDHIAIIVTDIGNDPNLLELENQNSRWSILRYFNTDDIQKAYDWLGSIEED